MNISTVSLRDYSSLRVGGVGSLVTVSTVKELEEALIYAKIQNLCAHSIGGGTNSYFGEDLSRFLFIKLAFKGISFKEITPHEVELTIAASENWDAVVQQSVERGLWGIENLSLIPGSVGAAPVQNIGAYGMELAEVFVSLSAFDTETMGVVTLNTRACKFGYRDSLFKHTERYIILAVTLKLYTKPDPVLHYKPLDTLVANEHITPQKVRDLVIVTRRAKLPDWVEYPNAGSFFKNPIIILSMFTDLQKAYPDIPNIETEEGYKIPAAWLIEHVAQMKGVRTGDVGTWPMQPLVIVNYGEATADDIDVLASEIREKVKVKTSIVLEQEVHRVG